MKCGSQNCKWKHRFVCLASVQQDRIPTTDQEKEVLYQADLGEKEIELDLTFDSIQFRETMYQAFPRLEKGGGYQFLKCTPNSRTLELHVLSPSTLSSPEILKSRIGAARTYIRPLQCDLDTIPVKDKSEVNELKEIYDFVKEDRNVSDSADDDDDCLPEFPPPISVSTPVSPVSPLRPLVPMSPSVSPSPISVSVPTLPYNSSTISVSVYDEDSVIKQSLNECIEQLNQQVSETDQCVINIRRQFVLEDTLKEVKRPKFSPERRLKVNFIGESGIDYGGLKREFFSLIAQQVKETYFIGNFICRNYLAVQNQDFYYIGMICVLSVVNGCAGFPFMSELIFKYLTTGCYDISSLNIDDLSDNSLISVLNKVKEVQSEDELRNVFGEDDFALDLLLQTGYKKPIMSLTLLDRPNIMSVLFDYHTMGRSKVELDQFGQGLGLFGFLEIVKSNPQLWKVYFCNDSILTPDAIQDIWIVMFSDNADRPIQELAYVNLLNFMDECKDRKIDCSLEEILNFFTGDKILSPIGYKKIPTIKFITGKLLTASLCAFELRLPIDHDNYESFKNSALLSIKGHDGFGKC